MWIQNYYYDNMCGLPIYVWIEVCYRDVYVREVLIKDLKYKLQHGTASALS